MKQPTFLNVLKDEIKKYNTHHGADGKFTYCDGSCGSGGGKGGKASGGTKSSGGSNASGGSGGAGGSSGSEARQKREVNMERRGQLGRRDGAFDIVSDECGVSAGEAISLGTAVNRFTRSDYIDIRCAQNGRMTADNPNYAAAKKDADLIEEYIKLAPKYDGPVYRGVQSLPDRLKGLKNGSVIDMNGVSSWSSEISVAKDFATTYDRNLRSVVFRLPKTNSGTAISHLSSLPSENEVLMSQQASFKITKVTKEKYVTYYDLVEVTSITKSLKALLYGGEVVKAGAGTKMKLVDRWLSDDDGFRIIADAADDVEKSNPHRGADGKFTNCDGSCGNGSGAAASSHGGTGAPDNNAGSGGKKNPGRIFYTPQGLEIIQNPTNEEYRQMYNEVSEKYPFLGPGEPRLRHTYDMDGNEYIWNAHEGIHTSVQPYINEAYGTKTDQHHKWWEKDEWREYVLNKSYDEDDGESNEFTIMKSDEDKRLVFGWGSVAINATGEQLVDYQGDMIDPEVMEEAAYEYVLNFRDTGEEHIPSMRKKGKLVESVVFTREKQAAMGIPEGILPVGWWVGFKIHDDHAWELVKSGRYRMFSIEGRAERIPVEKKRTFLETIDKANPHRGADGRFTNCDGSCKGSGSNSMIRQGPPPKKTKIAYKVFCVKNGKLYPPMVANPDAQDTPVGVWLDAQEGVKATNPDGTPVTNTLGRFKVKAGGKGTKGGGGTLAYRPGWHLGELPVADQFYTKNKETGRKEQYPNFVWAECEIAADIDYQKEAMSYGYTKNGKFQHSLAGLPRLPVDGCYKYRTNPDPNTKPWYITGAMKVNRILTDAETNKILRDNGIEPMPRKGGELDLEALGITERDFTVKKARSFLDILRKANPHRGADGKFTYCDGSCGNGKGAAGSKRNYGKTDVGDAVPGDCLSSHIGSDGQLTPEREELHKQIIDKFLEGKTPATGTPQLTMMGGGPASGKSTMIKEGFVKDPDTSSDTIKIDPDAIKAVLPEYKSMVEAGDKSASGFVHEESSALAKRLYSVALSEGINVTYDGTGDGSTKSVMKKVNAAKAQGYEIVGEYATCDIDEAIRRADARGKQTGRYVNHDYLKACHAKVTDIAYECSPQFDKINVYDISGDIKLIATGGNGKHLTAVDTAGFNSFMSKGQKFITLPNGQVVPVEE